MLNILLTYDYELFFNKSFASEKDVLIKPAYDIAKALSKEGVSATFFVDTPSVLAYKRNGLETYPKLVKEQVQFLLDTKHDVQLHIHPIWYKSPYNNGEWNFNNDFYALKTFPNVADILIESKACLDELADGNSNYKCCAFRAGGFCYSPVKEVTDTLISLGITIDSSVCKNLKMETYSQEFDYTQTPAKYNWFFDSKGMFQESTEKQRLFEIPIGTYSRIPNKWIFTHFMPKLVFPPRKGLSSPTVEKKKSSRFDHVKASFTTPVLFTNDSLHANALLKIVEFYEKKAKKNDIYIAVIAHPKLSSDVCVANTVSFIRLVKEKCHNTRFVTTKDVESLEKL